MFLILILNIKENKQVINDSFFFFNKSLTCYLGFILFELIAQSNIKRVRYQL